ncbi:hypothetical protein RB614_29685 [Phytohabitans sp. ZYX-F-186]|uniref:Uncharacterized protein n=1 Tax=Phytohabitans maris TaxID=3071409 RepID=A0ABU0ZNU6_9ACTN|nr:hypothetical protein [Phytohabitans sp. ZYX-F-186]MDQ7908712.1 hypothetical protein [Phytohabitans sp. ZYX-F-186]
MNEVADYVAQVRTALADLPPAIRDELLDDLPEHLAEVAAEGEGSLTERLGPPTAYAAELRAAAGAPAGRGRMPAMDARLHDVVVQARARLQAADAKTGPLIGYEKTSDFLRLLRPAWWVLRGYLAAMAVAYLLSNGPIGLLPRFEMGDSTVAGVVALVLFVIVSIWLGRRGSRLPRVPRLVLWAGIALLMLPAAVSLFEADEDAVREPYQGVSETYNDVGSVYVYDEQGRPLVNARVFDQFGNLVQPGVWWCPNEGGGMTTEVFPTCANPQPVNWQPAYVPPPPARGIPQSPSPAPEPTASPEPAPAPTGTPQPSATPTPAPTATG